MIAKPPKLARLTRPTLKVECLMNVEMFMRFVDEMGLYLQRTNDK